MKKLKKLALALLMTIAGAMVDVVRHPIDWWVFNRETRRHWFGIFVSPFFARRFWASERGTVLSAARQTQVREGKLTSYPVDGGSIIYKGAMVCMNAAGYLVPAANTAGFSNVVGVADETVDNSAGADGDLNCRVQSGRDFLFTASSITQAMVGTQMFVIDDQTFDDTSSQLVRAGMLVGFVSTTSGWIRIHVPQIAPGTIAAGDLGTGAVTAAKLNGALRTGFINLDLFTPRIISANDIQATTEAGVPDSNTAGPKIQRVNGATDKQGRLVWAATEVNEVQFPPVAYPPDLDDGAAVVVHILAKMAAGGMDTPVLTVAYFEGTGDTNAGGNTAALSVTLAEVTVSIAAGDVGAAPNVASITLLPAAHANEAVEVYAAWIEYTRKDN